MSIYGQLAIILLMVWIELFELDLARIWRYCFIVFHDGLSPLGQAIVW